MAGLKEDASELIPTIAGFALDDYGFLGMGKIHKAQIFMFIIGILLIIGGI